MLEKWGGVVGWLVGKGVGMGRRVAVPVRPGGREVSVVEGGELKEWQRGYGDWLSGYAGEPARAVRVKAASTLAGYQVKWEHLRALEERPAFRAYCRGVLVGDVAAARTAAEAEAHRTIVQWAAMRDKAYEAGDYKEFAKYANPILDRVWPRASEGGVGGGGVTVVLGGGSFAARTVREGGGLAEVTEVVVVSGPEE